MYKKVEGTWIAVEEDFKKETVTSKVDMVSLFARKINTISWMAPIYGGLCYSPGDMLWAFHLCMNRKFASYIIATDRLVDTFPVLPQVDFIKESLEKSEKAVVRGFYYFKRTGNRAVMKELTLEEMQEICK